MKGRHEFHWVDNYCNQKMLVVDRAEEFAKQLDHFKFMYVGYPLAETEEKQV